MVEQGRNIDAFVLSFFACLQLALLLMSFYLFMAVNNATLKYQQI